MKTLLYLIPFIAVFGCGQSESINSKGKDFTQKESRFSNLLPQYNNIGIDDTLFVFSEGEFVQSNHFKGAAIDSVNALLFPKEIAQANFIDSPSLFAVYQFAIDSNRVGLITRTPSEYLPSSIKLFIFDKAKDSITSYVELADNVGDAGDVSVKNSWIFRNKDRQVQTLLAVTDLHYNIVDNPRDSSIQTDNSYYLLDLSKHAIDTISDNKKQLAQQYAGLLETQRATGSKKMLTQ
jgi:hypothetical protein